MITLLFLIHLIHSLNLDGTEYNEINDRQYLLYYPEAFRSPPSKQTTLPLFVILHGGSVTSTYFLHKSDFHMVAEDKNFIALFPEGHCSLDIMCCWNSGHLRGLLEHNWEVDDMTYLDDLIDFIKTDNIVNKVNIGNIVLTGFSAGGFMTYTYAINTTRHEIHSIIPVAGSIGGVSAWYQPPQITYNPSNWGVTFKTNVIHIHGLLDANVLINGGYSYSRYDMSMNDAISFWLNQNECDDVNSTQIETDLDGTFVLTSYGECNYGMKVYSLVANEVHHEWSKFDSELQSHTKNNFAIYSQTLAELIYNLWSYKLLAVEETHMIISDDTTSLIDDDNPYPDSDPDTDIPDDSCNPIWPFYDCGFGNVITYVSGLIVLIIVILS